MSWKRSSRQPGLENLNPKYPNFVDEGGQFKVFRSVGVFWQFESWEAMDFHYYNQN